MKYVWKWTAKKEIGDKYLNFEGEIFFQVFDDHDEKGQLDTEDLLLFRRTGDPGGADIAAEQFQHQALHVGVRDALHVTIVHLHEEKSHVRLKKGKSDRVLRL